MYTFCTVWINGYLFMKMTMKCFLSLARFRVNAFCKTSQRRTNNMTQKPAPVSFPLPRSLYFLYILLCEGCPNSWWQEWRCQETIPALTHSHKLLSSLLLHRPASAAVACYLNCLCQRSHYSLVQCPVSPINTCHSASVWPWLPDTDKFPTSVLQTSTVQKRAICKA